MGPQVDFDVAQGLAGGQLGEGHCEELIQAREVLDLVLATMRRHTAVKRAQWQMRIDLREDELALVLDGPPRIGAKDRNAVPRRSSRHQTKRPPVPQANQQLTPFQYRNVGTLLIPHTYI